MLIGTVSYVSNVAQGPFVKSLSKYIISHSDCREWIKVSYFNKIGLKFSLFFKIDFQFHLLLNVAVGGGYFGDNAQYNTPKPWHGGSSHPMRDFWEHRGDWLPTWHGDDVAMLIDYVEMIQY